MHAMSRVEQLSSATSADAFNRNPRGRYWRDRRVIAWATRRCLGIILWGTLEPPDVQTIFELLSVDQREMPPAMLIDARRVRSCDPLSFAIAHDFYREHAQAFAARREREAVVVECDAIGAAIAGFYSVVPLPHRCRVFSDRDTALGWLAMPELAKTLLPFERILSSGEPDVLSGLRHWLEHDPSAARIKDAAAHLAMSERSLQVRCKSSPNPVVM
jgi:hypothetical protein